MNAQTTGKVVFKVFPPLGKTVVRVDDTLILNSNTVELKEGIHRVEFWAGVYGYQDTSFSVLPDTMLVFKMTLNRDANPAYLDYKEQLHQYNGFRIPNHFSYGAFAGGLGLYCTTLNYRKKVEKIRQEYLSEGPNSTDLWDSKNQLDTYKKRVVLKRNVSYGLVGTAILLKVYSLLKEKQYYEKYEGKPHLDLSSPFELGALTDPGTNGLSLKISF